MIAEYIGPRDPRWKQLLSRTPHDFYHLPEYVEFAARYEGGTPIAFYAEAGDAAFFIPLLQRELPPELEAPASWYDVTTPYGYPCPLLVSSDDESVFKHFLQAFQCTGADRGLVTAFIRLHPLLRLPQSVLKECGELAFHGQTVSIDLTLSIEDMWSQTSRNHRQNIRKLKRAGFQVEMDNWEYFKQFADIYRQTMERAQAEPFYFFSDDYFVELRQVLGSQLHLCTVCSSQSEVAAAGLFIAIDGIVQAHLCGTANKYLDVAPAKLLFDQARCWAKETGNRNLHLGGGVGAKADSLLEFKAGFSELRHEFYTYRMILDENKYAELNSRWQKRVDGAQVRSDFFPRYRTPPN